jgi:hypothetical protein
MGIIPEQKKCSSLKSNFACLFVVSDHVYKFQILCQGILSSLPGFTIYYNIFDSVPPGLTYHKFV